MTPLNKIGLVMLIVTSQVVFSGANQDVFVNVFAYVLMIVGIALFMYGEG